MVNQRMERGWLEHYNNSYSFDPFLLVRYTPCSSPALSYLIFTNGSMVVRVGGECNDPHFCR